MRFAVRPLDAAIALMLALIAGRIAGAEDPRAMFAGYLMLASLAAAVPVLLGALWLGFRQG